MHHGTAVVLLRSVANVAVLAFNHVIAFDRAHAICRFLSPRFYNVPRVLIADARSFQALAAILD